MGISGRTPRIVGLSVALALGLFTAAASPALSATTNRPNGPCSKVGATAKIKNADYVCTTKVGKKIWVAAAAATTAATTAAPATTQAPKGSDWDAIVAKAKDEGKVMLYSSQDPALLADMGAKFKAKYGITLEVYRDVDANLLPKVEAEHSTGKGIADVVAQASAPWAAQRASEGGWFVPVVGPDFSASTFNRAANMSKDAQYFTSSAAILTFGWNTKQYPKGLTDYKDLLDPALGGGKIGVIDPNGSAAITDFYLYLEEKYGASFVAKLANQRPRIYVSSLPMKAAILSGEISAGLFIPPPMTEKAQGAPIDFGFAESVWGARFNTSVLKTAPHPNAAQVLADFMITKEAQEIIAKVSGSVYPGIGVMTTDKVRVQNVSKLSADQVAAFNDKWRIQFT